MRKAALLLLSLCSLFALVSGACEEPRLCNETECKTCDAVCCDASPTALPSMLVDACGAEVNEACKEHGGVLQSFRGDEPFLASASTCSTGSCVVRCCGGGIFVSQPADASACIFFGGNAKLCRDEGGPKQILFDGQLVFPESVDVQVECPSLKECVVVCDSVEKSRTTEFTEGNCVFFHKDLCAGAMTAEITYNGAVVYKLPP